MDVNNRDKKERDIARRLARVFNEHFENVMDLLGDPPDFNRLTPEYWEQFDSDLRQALSVPINEIFYEQFTTALDEFGLSIDDSAGSEEALNFVQRYVFDLVKDIEGTTMSALRKEINAYIQDGGMTLEDLANRLHRYYSPVRAEMIAITETTRAAAQGELATVGKVADESGIQFDTIWQTSNDERVCPICGPRHNQVITDGQYPPAHPRCRCWINHRVRE